MSKVNNLGNFKATKVDILNWDVDFWGVDDTNKEDQLSLLVSDEILFETFRNEKVWKVSELNDEYIFCEMLENGSVGEIVSIP